MEYNELTIEDVWIPSSQEILSGFSDQSKPETNGPVYTELFAESEDAIKQKSGESSASWWLRSAGYSINGNNVYFRKVSIGDDSLSYSPTCKDAGGVVLCFCI